jgi:hypothetical protein
MSYPLDKIIILEDERIRAVYFSGPWFAINY